MRRMGQRVSRPRCKKGHDRGRSQGRIRFSRTAPFRRRQALWCSILQISRIFPPISPGFSRYCTPSLSPSHHNSRSQQSHLTPIAIHLHPVPRLKPLCNPRNPHHCRNLQLPRQKRCMGSQSALLGDQPFALAQQRHQSSRHPLHHQDAMGRNWPLCLFFPRPIGAGKASLSDRPRSIAGDQPNRSLHLTRRRTFPPIYLAPGL